MEPKLIILYRKMDYNDVSGVRLEVEGSQAAGLVWKPERRKLDPYSCVLN